MAYTPAPRDAGGDSIARIAVITDSSACIPRALIDRYGIRVLPIRIHLQSGDLDDGMEHAPARVYESLAEGDSVKSSAPTPLDYLSSIESVDADAGAVITPAAEFTTMYRSAVVASDIVGRRVTVVDSRTAAAAHGLVVLAAAEAALAYGTLEEVVAAAEEASRRAELVASLQGVEHIRRSGRVPPAALGLARKLGVRPVFRLTDGSVERLGIPRSEDAALGRIRREWAAREGSRATRSAVFHATAKDRAGRLSRLLGGADYTVEFSPSMGIHTGPGLVGVAWLRPPA